MSETLFIADLHLHPSQPATVLLFFTFLQQRAPKAEALYILGDLFEAWLGDDEENPALLPIITALKTLADRGTRLYFMHGNRDFLLGQSFATRCHGELITTDVHKVDLYGTPTLLMHGDTLCTQDEAYQRFRQQVRNPAWQQQFLALPIEQRRQAAQQARQQSQVATQQKAEAIMDVTPEAVHNIMQMHAVSHLIHGHTHRPACHEFSLAEQSAYRYVVGDWHAQHAIILSCRPELWQLETS